MEDGGHVRHAAGRVAQQPRRAMLQPPRCATPRATHHTLGGDIFITLKDTIKKPNGPPDRNSDVQGLKPPSDPIHLVSTKANIFFTNNLNKNFVSKINIET